jgi:uncharacterized protein YdgA (DUF945 family)
MKGIRKCLAISLVLLLLIAGVPFGLGIWIKHSYLQLIAFENGLNQLHIELLHYHRGWLSSDVDISVEPVFPGLNRTAQQERVILHQHIQHGPILYQPNKSQLFTVNLAAIQNRLELANADKSMNSSLASIVESDDSLNFLGEYKTKFRLTGFKSISSKLEVGEMKGNALFWPMQKRVEGDINIANFMLNNTGFLIAANKLYLLFNQYQSADGLWLGNHSLTCADVTFSGASNKSISLLGISMQGYAEEVANQLNGMRQITIDKIQADGLGVGPVILEVGVQGLNPAGFMLLLNKFHDLLSQGFPLAELQQQFIIFLPKIIQPGSRLKVSRLQVTTPNGSLLLQGEIEWPQQAVLPKNIKEIMQASSAQCSLRISMPLASMLLRIGANLFSPAIIPSTMPKEATRVQKENALLVLLLVQQKQLSKTTATKLIALQKQGISEEKYVAAIKSMTAANEISAETEKLLSSHYVNFHNQDAIKTSTATQFSQWLKAGYLIQDKNDYILSLIYDHGVLKINGHSLSP